MPWYWPFSRDDKTSEFNRLFLIEGISDDTLLLVILFACLIGLWIYYSRRGRHRTIIHPDNQQDVELLRQRTQEHRSTMNGTTSSARTRRRQLDTCPICLEDSLVYGVETNCGHLFCGNCIITYWKFQSNWMNGLKCPVCRQQATVLLTCFTDEEQSAPANVHRQIVVDGVKEFNRRFAGVSRTWLEYFYDIPVLIPYIFRQIFSTDSLRLAYRLRIIFIFISAMAYVISPLDILPESILGIFGLIDDFLIILGSAIVVIVSFRQHVANG